MKINTTYLENIILEETHELLKEFTNEPDPGKRDEACGDDELLKEQSAAEDFIKIKTLYGQYEQTAGDKAGWWWCAMTLYADDVKLLRAVASAPLKERAGYRALRRIARKITKSRAKEIQPHMQKEGPNSADEGPGTPIADPKKKNIGIKESVQRIVKEEVRLIIEEDSTITKANADDPMGLQPETPKPSHIGKLWVFGAEWCGPCKYVKKWLKKNNIKFNYVDVEKPMSSEARKVAAKAFNLETGWKLPSFAVSNIIAGPGKDPMILEPDRIGGEQTFDAYLSRIIKQFNIAKLQNKGTKKSNPKKK